VQTSRVTARLRVPGSAVTATAGIVPDSDAVGSASGLRGNVQPVLIAAAWPAFLGVFITPKRVPVEHVSGWDPTAWTTLGLAVVTALAVIISFFALRQTQTELGISREEVRQSHRPLLFCADAKYMTLKVEGTELVSEGMVLTLKNIGVGPAIDTVAHVQLRGDDGRPSQGGGTNWWTGRKLGIAAGASLDVFVHVDRLADLPCFAFALEYSDVAGERWYSTGIYLLSRATGTTPTVVEPRVGRMPKTGSVPEPKMPDPPAALNE
jgi:hypothetical protein